MGRKRYKSKLDPIQNPFAPGAGSPPPELVGREGILEQAEILLGRVRQKKSEKSMLLTGLRGVGKTVLLNESAGVTAHQMSRYACWSTSAQQA